MQKFISTFFCIKIISTDQLNKQGQKIFNNFRKSIIFRRIMQKLTRDILFNGLVQFVSKAIQIKILGLCFATKARTRANPFFSGTTFGLTGHLVGCVFSRNFELLKVLPGTYKNFSKCVTINQKFVASLEFFSKSKIFKALIVINFSIICVNQLFNQFFNLT